MSEPKLKLLQGPAIEEALRAEETRLFGYVLNKPGLYLIGVMGTAAAAAAGWVWFGIGTASTLWMATFVLLAVVALAVTLFILYWHSFATSRFVGISQNHLFVGAKDSLWQIDWELLDAQSMGFEAMELSKMKGVLTVGVGGQQIPLHLFNAFAFLDDIQGFMFLVLEQFGADPDAILESAEAPDEELADEAS